MSILLLLICLRNLHIGIDSICMFLRVATFSPWTEGLANDLRRLMSTATDAMNAASTFNVTYIHHYRGGRTGPDPNSDVKFQGQKAMTTAYF